MAINSVLLFGFFFLLAFIDPTYALPKLEESNHALVDVEKIKFAAYSTPEKSEKKFQLRSGKYVNASYYEFSFKGRYARLDSHEAFLIPIRRPLPHLVAYIVTNLTDFSSEYHHELVRNVSLAFRTSPIRLYSLTLPKFFQLFEKGPNHYWYHCLDKEIALFQTPWVKNTANLLKTIRSPFYYFLVDQFSEKLHHAHLVTKPLQSGEDCPAHEHGAGNTIEAPELPKGIGKMV